MTFSTNDPAIIDELENYFMSQPELHDLHTHLLGMGDEKFWIHKILMKETILPTHQAFVNDRNLRRRLCRLVWNPYKGEFLNEEDVESIFQYLVIHDYPKQESLTNLQSLIESKLRRSMNVNTAYQNGPWGQVEQTIRNALPASPPIDQNHLNSLIQKLKVLIQPELPEQTSVFYSMIQETNEFKRELENRGLSFKNDFCYDVVLKLDDLASGLGVTDQTNQFIQTAVEEKLGFHLRLSKDRPTFRHWIIFNARQQCFEVAYGIRAEDLRELIRTDSEKSVVANQIAYGHIVNAISMRDPQGTHARPIDFHSFQGMFTPEFYPRRFVLKDSIYSQRLDVLARLLHHVLLRYDRCHPAVTYCELSVGVGDLSRPWVFDVLCSLYPSTQDPKNASSSFRDLLEKGHFSPYQKDIINNTSSQLQLTWRVPKCTYKFLAGFKRQDVQTSYFENQKQAIDLLNEAPQIAIHLMLNEIKKSDREEYISEKTDTFYKHKEALDKMRVSIRDEKRFYHWVVGLDLFGDEMGFPYCAFVARNFIDYVKEIREKFNESFGLRIHCGENVPFADATDPAYRHFAAHMYIAFRCLRYLQHKLEYGIRVGHGIAFQRILDGTMSSSKHRKSSVLLAEIEQQAPYVFEKIPFEVNITSNEYLLGFALRNGTRKRPLQLNALFDVNVPIILATDNDGIWPIAECSCDQFGHFSLSGECCRAIQTGIIKSKEHLERMFENMKTYRFCSENTELINNKADISKLPHDPRAFSVIIHPDIIKFIIGLCSEPEQKKGKFYDAFQAAYSSASTRPTNQRQLSPEELEEQEAWKKTCLCLARTAYVSYCAENSEKYPVLDGDTVFHYNSLFGELPNVTQVLKEWKNVYQQFIKPNIIEQSQCISTESGDHVFFSEGPTDPNDKKRPMKDLINYLRHNYHRHKKTHIHAFTRHINVATTISEIEKQSKRDATSELDVSIYSNKAKEKYVYFDLGQKLVLKINHESSKRTDHNGESQRNGLYAICPHASAATAFLHFISKELSSDANIPLPTIASGTSLTQTTDGANHDVSATGSSQQTNSENVAGVLNFNIPLSTTLANADPTAILNAPTRNDQDQQPTTSKVDTDEEDSDEDRAHGAHKRQCTDNDLNSRKKRK